ncbi:hypothetical protein [Cellulomonas xiejunii]|uniref:Uncharacterized protein n=1 Tax=Cellulomonas xiejunii TaxID=2968083 RepID=A0ABY5KNC6_9CELL|nr:hypothetical protein [Cellulomonas xiejunii]MCC2319752.1 hypothetical protein [Cellulomonas xiejunii]UUI71310.1 hypothetical protein NP048_16160 [Cellulomonas xiejunii]
MTTTDVTRPSPTLHTVKSLRRTVLRMAAWFWGLAVAGVALATLVVWLVDGEVDQLIAVLALQGGIWFPFSQAIAISGTYLVAHVAAGMTRRTFARAALVVAVVTGFGYAVALGLLVLAERALHLALGWGVRTATVGLPVGDPSVGDLLAALAALVVPFVLANVAGLLVGIVYQRLGGLWGTLTLPFTVGPLVLVLYVLPFVPFLGLPEGGPRIALGALVGGLLAAACAAVFATLARRTQLASTTG